MATMPLSIELITKWGSNVFRFSITLIIHVYIEMVFDIGRERESNLYFGH